MVWFVFWILFVASSPEQDPRITPEELEYIQKSIKNVSEERTFRTDVPWMRIFTSMPVWAIVVSHFGENWGFYTLLTQLPKHLKGIHFN